MLNDSHHLRNPTAVAEKSLSHMSIKIILGEKTMQFLHVPRSCQTEKWDSAEVGLAISIRCQTLSLFVQNVLKTKLQNFDFKYAIKIVSHIQTFALEGKVYIVTCVPGYIYSSSHCVTLWQDEKHNGDYNSSFSINWLHQRNHVLRSYQWTLELKMITDCLDKINPLQASLCWHENSDGLWRHAVTALINTRQAHWRSR